MISQQHHPTVTVRSHAVAREWPLLGALTLPFVLGCLSIYLFRFSGEDNDAWFGLTFLTVGLLASTATALLSVRPSVSAAASALALVQSVALFTVLLPSSGNIYIDATVLFIATAGIVLLYSRTGALPSLGTTRLRESSVLVVLLLPILLAFAEAYFLGLRFWESYQIGRPSLLFVPLVAMWGFVEEGLFRGIVQRSLVPSSGNGGSILFSAVVYAAFMLFWGSLIYAIFAFFLGLLMGSLYLRSRSLMYVGTIHALQDTWMIIAYLALGIVVH